MRKQIDANLACTKKVFSLKEKLCRIKCMLWYHDNIWNAPAHGADAWAKKICLFTVGGFTKCSTSKEKRRAKPTRRSMWNIKRIFLFFLINEGKKVKVLTWKPQQKQWSLTQHNILRHRQSSQSQYISFTICRGSALTVFLSVQNVNTENTFVYSVMWLEGGPLGTVSAIVFAEVQISLLCGHYWVNFKSTNLSIAPGLSQPSIV